MTKYRIYKDHSHGDYVIQYKKRNCLWKTVEEWGHMTLITRHFHTLKAAKAYIDKMMEEEAASDLGMELICEYPRGK